MLLAGCERQPAEDKVTHPDSHGGPYLRSEYKVVGRELKEYDDYSGKYVMLTIKHGENAYHSRMQYEMDDRQR